MYQIKITLQHAEIIHNFKTKDECLAYMRDLQDSGHTVKAFEINNLGGTSHVTYH